MEMVWSTGNCKGSGGETNKAKGTQQDGGTEDNIRITPEELESKDEAESESTRAGEPN